jgi:hypothetical protein
MPELWRTQASRLQRIGIEVCWRPAQGGVSGDFHDIIDLNDGRVVVILGDAPGSGAAAADMGEDLRFQLRRAFRFTDDVAAAIRQLDDRFARQYPDAIATVVCALLDPARGQVEVTNAGHPPIVLTEATNARFLDGSSDPPLGVMTDRHPITHRLTGDSALFMFTDGLVERRDEPLGRGLGVLLDAARGLTGAVAWASELARRASAELGQPSDDATVLSVDLRRAPTPGLAAGAPVMLRVYVDPSDLVSAATEAVTRQLVDGLLKTMAVHVETVDITASPRTAEADGVIAAPTVVRVSPAPPVRVVGALRSPAQLARALQLPYPKEGDR